MLIALLAEAGHDRLTNYEAWCLLVYLTTWLIVALCFWAIPVGISVIFTLRVVRRLCDIAHGHDSAVG